jgi:hypothetical protein
MDYPKDWRNQKSRTAEVGHQETGKTVGLHSLAVLPRLQRSGLGVLLVKAFLDQMRCYGVVDRVALICQDVSILDGMRLVDRIDRASQDLVSYYERIGFKNFGQSKAQFGGGGWNDMVSIPFARPMGPHTLVVDLRLIKYFRFLNLHQCQTKTNRQLRKRGSHAEVLLSHAERVVERRIASTAEKIAEMMARHVPQAVNSSHRTSHRIPTRLRQDG